MTNILIEIGVEEFPISCLDVIYLELPKFVSETLRKERIEFKQVLVEATPRRIAIFIEETASKQKDCILEISGPSYEKSYDSEGNPTNVLFGFLKSKQAKEKDIEIREVQGKGKFVFLKKNEKGKSVKNIIPFLIEKNMAALPFSKRMRWEQSGFRFPRPIRWIVALFGKNQIVFEMAGVRSSDKSFGNRFLSPKSFSILKADWNSYRKLLRKKHVLLNLEERKKLVKNALTKRFLQKEIDQELVEQSAQLVEVPYFVLGKFSKEYLELPAEVLASCMKKNQKIFACYDSRGRLKNNFVAVLNGKRKGINKIISNYENVLESRLKDARYFFEADTKEPLDKKKQALKDIMYLGKLGSFLEKTNRLEKMAPVFLKLVGREDLNKDLVRIASLSKIDLTTQLVYEFPDLQGVVGGEYSRESGEREEIANAISTQYLPKNLSENYEKISKHITLHGALFGILDRLDLLIGAFGIGLEPTGSQDPFALRRAGGSLVKLIRAFHVHFSLSEIIKNGIRFFDKKLTVQNNLEGRIKSFLEERIYFEMGLRAGTREHEIIKSVLKSSFDDIENVYERYTALYNVNNKNPEMFLKAAKIVQRTANILKGYKDTGERIVVKPELLTGLYEKTLFELISAKSDIIKKHFEKKEYEEGTKVFSEVFYAPLCDFFDNVMVNVDDQNIRKNRMGLMRNIYSLYTENLADLSILSRLD